MDIKNLYRLYKKSFLVSTDTRSDLNNSMFFALKGENFNGNKFAEQALKDGANYAVIDEKEYQTNDRIILVKNVLETLQKLANFHRKELNIPIVALTGSNGKTTTKELINIVLSQKYNCYATSGNFNNHIGVPLSLLAIKPDVEIGVIEMGANHPDEIDFLCEIALPDYGYITNFGRVHLEGFKNLAGVIQAKTEMYRHIKKRNKTLFVNATDDVQLEKSEEIKRVTFGNISADYPVQFISANPFVTLKFDNTHVKSQLIGSYNYMNIAAAIAIGKHFKVKDVHIKKAIEQYIPSNNRSEIVQKGKIQIILDAYNANPNSMMAALENLSQLSAVYKIAILGDMFEIGKDSRVEHEKIVRFAEQMNLRKLVLIGKQFSDIEVISSNTIQFQNFDDFKSQFDKNELENATVLIKASRGMALERVLNLL